MENSKNFVILGASGYIASRHMKAIKQTNNQLVGLLDPYDGIGIVDDYFPDASFFKEIEILDRFIDKFNKNDSIDFMSITSPNYLHDSHIRFAIKNNCHAICEKPIVLNPHNLESLKLLENTSDKKINTILQLRLHPSIIALKDKISKELKNNPNKVYDIDLSYITSRGKWYLESWKGNEAKSGGISSNIGVHFFDILLWIFGAVKDSILHIKTQDVNAGILHLKNANIRWFLSINHKYLSQELKIKNKKTFRSIIIDGEEIEFSDGFFDLHTKSYEEILKNNGFSLNDVSPSIDIISNIRKADIVSLSGDYHPYIKKLGI